MWSGYLIRYTTSFKQFYKVMNSAELKNATTLRYMLDIWLSIYIHPILENRLTFDITYIKAGQLVNF